MNQRHNLKYSLKHIFSHITISLLAVGIAFSLPIVAQYILYKWWPMVEYNARLLLVTEVIFATALVMLFNVSKIAWDSRRRLQANTIASLVHAKDKAGSDWSSRRNDKALRESLQGTREISILSVTGSEIFSDNNWVRHVLDNSYEVRVLLMNPEGDGAYQRTRLSANPAAVLEAYRREIEHTINYLAKLVSAGTRVSIKFYDAVPFWRMVVAGDYVQVQYCYGTVKGEWPEYIFALRKDQPGRGLFTPFYVNFLNQWQDVRLPDYDFETRELVYRNSNGNEVKRELFDADTTQQKIAESSLKLLIDKLQAAKIKVNEVA